jgi:hypothetical protein
MKGEAALFIVRHLSVGWYPLHERTVEQLASLEAELQRHLRERT